MKIPCSSPINTFKPGRKRISWKSTGTLHLQKLNPPEYISKLTTKKYRNLSLDLDKWKSESDLEEEAQNIKMKELNNEFSSELKTNIQHLKKSNTIKVLYLIAYNSLQFVLYGSVFLINFLGLFVINDRRNYEKYHPYPGDTPTIGHEILSNIKYFPAFERTSDIMNSAILLSFLEIIHIKTGLCKISNSWGILLQTVSRGLLIYWINKANFKNEDFENLSDHIIVAYLFLAWSLSEILRYLNYLMLLFKSKTKSGILFFIKHHSFIFLLPLCGILEVCTMYFIFRPYFKNDNTIWPSLYNKFINVGTVFYVFVNYQFMMRQRRKNYLGIKPDPLDRDTPEARKRKAEIEKICGFSSLSGKKMN